MAKTKKELEKEIKDLKKKVASLEVELQTSNASVELLKGLIKKQSVPNYNIWPYRRVGGDKIC